MRINEYEVYGIQSYSIISSIKKSHEILIINKNQLSTFIFMP